MLDQVVTQQHERALRIVRPLDILQVTLLNRAPLDHRLESMI